VHLVRSLLLLLLVAVAACGHTPTAALHPTVTPPPPFALVDTDMTRTARTPDGCVSLELDRRWHTLTHRRGAAPTCPRLEDALPLLRDMLVALDRNGELRSVTSFSVGRDYESFYTRLAIAAARSPDWDVHRGQPKSGNPNAFVVQIAHDSPRFFPEMVTLLAVVHLRPELRGVEKVLIGTPAQTPFRERLESTGVPERAKVPFDCIVAFHLVPE
jgi:hypothetical protein